MIHPMNEEEEPSVLGALPHSRPHRRSAKRETRSVSTEGVATTPAAAGTAAAGTAAKRTAAGTAAKRTAAKRTAAAGTATREPATKRTPAQRPAAAASAAAEPTTAAEPAPPLGQSEEPGMGAAELVTTVVQAAAELAEIGLTAGARALRIAVSRLPRP
jgi:hypothetical protein